MSLTEYSIGRHCGVTFAGLKIASLVSLAKGEEDVVFRLARSFSQKGFAFVLLREDGERLPVYVYHRVRLHDYLQREEIRAFLHTYGYSYRNEEEAIVQLRARMGEAFPHEIGIFLGYPLADVCGFIRDPYGCLMCGAWKVYANVDKAQRTFEQYRRCSACICRHMQQGRSLAQIFNVK